MLWCIVETFHRFVRVFIFLSGILITRWTRVSQLWRFCSCFQGVESVKKEIGDLGHTGPYRPPARLRKRSEFSSKGGEEKVFEANE